jgi:hypothetical protein
VLLREPRKPQPPAVAQLSVVALAIGDRDDRVVEGGVHVRDRICYVLLHLLAWCYRGVIFCLSLRGQPPDWRHQFIS